PPDHPDVVRIRLGKVGWTNPRAFGDVWLGLWLWKFLHLDAIVDRHLPQGKGLLSRICGCVSARGDGRDCVKEPVSRLSPSENRTIFSSPVSPCCSALPRRPPRPDLVPGTSSGSAAGVSECSGRSSSSAPAVTASRDPSTRPGTYWPTTHSCTPRAAGTPHAAGTHALFGGCTSKPPTASPSACP